MCIQTFLCGQPNAHVSHTRRQKIDWEPNSCCFVPVVSFSMKRQKKMSAISVDSNATKPSIQRQKTTTTRLAGTIRRTYLRAHPANLLNVAGMIILKHFDFFRNVSSPKSQRMPMHTNALFWKQIRKIPNHKRDTVKRGCIPAVTCTAENEFSIFLNCVLHKNSAIVLRDVS